MEKIVLIGGGGHCKVIIDAITKSGGYEITGIIDPKKKGEEVSGIPVLGGEEVLEDLYKEGIKNAFIAVGSVGDCSARKNIYEKVKGIGFNLPAVIHPAAIIANEVEVGDGTFIAASATVNPGTTIGKNAIINTSSSIDHDCQIGDFVHIAPGVTLSGGVKIGDETHIGTGASVVQYITIGKGCMIDAGTRLSKDLADGQRHTLKQGT